MPTAQDFAEFSEAYKRLSPHPEQFHEFLAVLSGDGRRLQGWTDEQLAGIAARVLMVQGDLDFTTVEHAAFMLDHPRVDAGRAARHHPHGR